MYIREFPVFMNREFQLILNMNCPVFRVGHRAFTKYKKSYNQTIFLLHINKAKTVSFHFSNKIYIREVINRLLGPFFTVKTPIFLHKGLCSE